LISIHQVAQIFGPGLDVAVFVLFDAYPLCMFVNLPLNVPAAPICGSASRADKPDRYIAS
jgi:hypothetical protein